MNEYKKWINKNKTPPDDLFHYTTVDGFHNICESTTFRATHINYLNDSSEYKDAQKRFIEILDKEKDKCKDPINRKNADSLVNKYKNNHSLSLVNPQHVYIISFTKNYDDLSQWRAYCHDGGVMMGFNSKQLCWVASHQKHINKFILIKCIYNARKKKKLIDELVFWYILNEKPVANSDLLNRLARLSCAFKHHAFHSEREWRLVCSDIHWDEEGTHTPTANPYKPVEVKFRLRENMLIPYINFSLNTRVINDYQNEQLKLYGYAHGYTHGDMLNLQDSPDLYEDKNVQSLFNNKMKSRGILKDKYLALYEKHADRTKLPLPLSHIKVGPGNYDQFLLSKSISNYINSKIDVLDYLASEDRLGHEQYEAKFNIQEKWIRISVSVSKIPYRSKL